MTFVAVPRSLSRALSAIGTALQSPLLFALRAYWGWSFFQTGKGKLLHLDDVAGYFASLHIPAPKLNALAAGSVETFGGLLLILGLGSRLVAVPLIFTLCVAYATAERDALLAIVSDPDKFTAATPFLFLLAVAVVFAFGPGKWSLDWLCFGRKAAVAADDATATSHPPALTRAE